MEYLKLKENKDIFRLGIIDEKGNIVKDGNGNEVCLEFDVGDIDLPIKYSKCVNLIRDAKQKLKSQMIIINKKQDHKGKQLLSANEEATVKAIKTFYREMEEAMDWFLGKGGTRKFLNGRNPYFEMFDDLGEAIEPFMDKLNLTVDNMKDRIKNKYKVTDSDVLTDE